jgi:uncharacterized protein (TIGR03118 family)
MKIRQFAWIATSVAFSIASGAQAQIATFDFDTRTPLLTPGQNIPFDQTSGGMTASFSSPNGSVFSVQNDTTTQFIMKLFSGNYLYDNNLNVNPLDVKFSQHLNSITLTLATADFNQNETPTTLQLTAYLDSTSSTPVGVATAHGTYGGSTMPMGTLTFNSNGTPFNLVEITIVPGPLAASDFLVDDIQASRLVTSSTYHVTKLVSDVAGLAPGTDANLVNPWGMARGAGTASTPWWVANTGTGNVTAYDGNGGMMGTVVTVPAADGSGAGSPTGMTLFAGNFLAATLDGTLARWPASTLGGTATTVLNHSSTASYTGITLAVRNGVNVLYMANSRGGIEAYNAWTFQPVKLPQGAFTDPAIPAGYTPYNVQAIGSQIYVTFTSGGSGGYADAFDVNGTLLISLQSGAWMKGPWGIAVAPANFGKYSHTLLVANHGSGQIYAYNPGTGKVLGVLKLF